MAPSAIIDALALKSHAGHRRADSMISKMMQINEENAQMQCGYSKSSVDMERSRKSKNLT